VLELDTTELEEVVGVTEELPEISDELDDPLLSEVSIPPFEKIEV
jgi:hypothetical protein